MQFFWKTSWHNQKLLEGSSHLHYFGFRGSRCQNRIRSTRDFQEKEGRRNRVGRVLDCSKFQGGFSLADGDPSSWSHPLELFVLPFWVIGEISLQEVTPHRPCWWIYTGRAGVVDQWGFPHSRAFSWLPIT